MVVTELPLTWQPLPLLRLPITEPPLLPWPVWILLPPLPIALGFVDKSWWDGRGDCDCEAVGLASCLGLPLLLFNVGSWFSTNLPFLGYFCFLCVMDFQMSTKFPWFRWVLIRTFNSTLYWSSRTNFYWKWINRRINFWPLTLLYIRSYASSVSPYICSFLCKIHPHMTPHLYASKIRQQHHGNKVSPLDPISYKRTTFFFNIYLQNMNMMSNLEYCSCWRQYSTIWCFFFLFL